MRVMIIRPQPNIVYIRATVAQLVEQLIRNQQVAGSNPASSSTKKKKDFFLLLFLLTLFKQEP